MSNVPPNPLVVQLLGKLPEHSIVLDLGCGCGRNAIYIAKAGHAVLAVDKRKEAIEGLIDRSIREGLRILGITGDICDVLEALPHKQYDAVVCINALQFNPRARVYKAIELMQQVTKPLGFNAIESFVVRGDEEREWAIKQGWYGFKRGELQRVYEGWTMLTYSEALGPWEQHDGFPKHRHFLVRLLARKG
ncbi:hypothetical protein DRJ48_01295 [Candidatus Woesearchaeota archaeon]|nr:methyltransferase domain-containing protein [Candidatus Woesearchaeota archaeon]RLE43300.1 MAG: hypothetical protein DRJ48_01295 [Candidatus Woesearchaeota archaeon]